MKNYESLIDALDDLKKRGYQADFAIQTVCLYCGDLDLRLNPEEFNIDEVYRFESNSNPGDSSILYAISSSSGVKGTLVDSYGAYADSLSFEMAKKLWENHQESIETFIAGDKQ
ncbi:MAG: phosphoribosylpyrophosphate synthetase [Bacteroidota bacterium]